MSGDAQSSGKESGVYPATHFGSLSSERCRGTASEQKFLKAWHQWEVDTKRKIQVGTEQWNEKIRTFMVAKQDWQTGIKQAAMEQSLDKMLGSTGSALNERLKALSDASGINGNAPQMNVSDLVSQAMQDFNRGLPAPSLLFGEIDKSIAAFNTTLEITGQAQFKGFNDGSLEGSFAQDTADFARHEAILTNVKMYEAFKDMIEQFKTQLKSNDTKVEGQLQLAATTAGYHLSGGTFSKDAGLMFGGRYDFMDYRKADIDGIMNRAMSESGVEQKSGEDMVNFLENGRDIDVKLFFNVQTMALEQAFKLVAGDGKGNKGYYGNYVGDIATWNGDSENPGSGELGGWENGQANNKLTYRGLHYEEKALAAAQGRITTGLQITAAIAGAATGSLAFTLAMQGSQQLASLGAVASSGGDISAMLGMAAIQMGTSAFASFAGGLNYFGGLSEGATAAEKVATSVTQAYAQAAVSYVGNGFQIGADGRMDYKLSSGGALNALVQGSFAAIGKSINSTQGLLGPNGNAVAAGTVSSTFDAIGAGIHFNDNGSLQQNYDWKSAGVSFASNMASTVVSGYAGAKAYNAGMGEAGSGLMGQQMGRLANTVTTALLTQNSGVWNNNYGANGFASGLGTYIGDQGAQAFNASLARQMPQAPAQPAGNQQPLQEIIGGATIVTSRREENILDGILQGFGAIGSATAGAASAIGGGIAGMASGVWNGITNAANFVVANTYQRIANGLSYGSFSTDAGFKMDLAEAMAKNDPAALSNGQQKYVIQQAEKTGDLQTIAMVKARFGQQLSEEEQVAYQQLAEQQAMQGVTRTLTAGTEEMFPFLGTSRPVDLQGNAAELSLEDQLLVKYVGTTKTEAEKWIKSLNLTDKEEEKALLTKLTVMKKQWGTRQGRLDLQEQSLILNLGMHVSDEIAMTNAKTGTDRFDANKNGKFYSNTIRLIDGEIAENPSQAENMPDFTNNLHYRPTKENPDQKDTAWKADLLGREAGGNLAWYGPNTKFQVNQVLIVGDTDPSHNYTADKGPRNYHGTLIQLELLDENNKSKGTLNLMHMTAINQNIYNAAGTGTIFNAGTFLGITGRYVGSMSGPHLHMASTDTSQDRTDMWNLWRGK